MKIQSLAIIFVIIILPLSIVLSEYTQLQISTISVQSSYDSSLISATYDAVVAYQLNSLNDSSNNIVNSRIRNIEASANIFLTSIASNFSMSGNSSKTINEYVPAIVYTMYDGYYIYSPYINDISGIYGDDADSDPSYTDGETLDGLKPYIYYSCRYKTGNIDVVITYSLDNYITIQGTVGDDYWNKSGYFLNKVSYSESTRNITYNGVEIPNSETLTEQIYDPDTRQLETYRYAKIDGTKYYLDNNDNAFYIQNDEKNTNVSDEIIDMIEENTSAYDFYYNAYYFTKEVKNAFGTLSFSDAVDEEGNSISENGFTENSYIFGGTVDAEEESSNFTVHRTAVIRYSIEKNLSIAIANYDEKFGGTTAFSMPNLSEEDWYKIINQTSVITFLQGFPMGTKLYNGYAVLTNNKNNDVVTDYSIYITALDGAYHRIDESGLNDIGELTGYLNVDFEKKTNDSTNYYYSRPETASYVSIVNQTGTVQIDNIYEYLSGTQNTELAEAYYTALRA